MSSNDEHGKRWIMRSLVERLIHEMTDYEGAAEVVSGAGSALAVREQDIKEKVEEVERELSVAASFGLQQSLEKAHHEIAGHRAWQEEVISGLPKEDEKAGLTGPVRMAFARTAEARERLYIQVKNTYAKYFSTPS